jgi:NADPH:quinone reductase-like Zn-dependent oxidoreductase
VQIAKMYGAEVTGVCSSSKMDFVKTLGSDYVIDYLKQDIIDGGTAYDLIYDVAAHHSTREIRKILNKDGEYVIAGGSISRIFQLMFKSIFGIKNMSVVMAKPGKVDMLMISKLMESGKIKSYIDKVYPLEETADAIRYLDEGKVKGKVVVSVTKEA